MFEMSKPKKREDNSFFMDIIHSLEEKDIGEALTGLKMLSNFTSHKSLVEVMTQAYEQKEPLPPYFSDRIKKLAEEAFDEMNEKGLLWESAPVEITGFGPTQEQ